MAGKRVVVIGDNAALCGAVQVVLTTGLGMELVEASPASGGAAAQHEQGAAPDLIVVIQCDYAGEPLLLLIRSNLICLLGQVPMLIISGRPSDARREEQIAHLHFPFSRAELEGTVRRLLSAN